MAEEVDGCVNPAGVLCYQTPPCTVRQAIDMFRSYRLRRVEKPGRALSPNR